ncbi:MAG TPA: hypothetical protein VHZ29_10690 [Rhizomicrobium sp.]|nr:hypothetical protein [Rhizomicrobium sp.]
MTKNRKANAKAKQKSRSTPRSAQEPRGFPAKISAERRSSGFSGAM